MQTPTQARNIGADFAKDEIVMACADESFPVRKLANKCSALSSFLKSLPPGSRIGMESTGIHHELLADLARRQVFIVYVLNPKDGRNYAKTSGYAARTIVWMQSSSPNIDRRIKALIDANPDRKEHVTHLRTIDGVGQLVGAALANTLERISLKNADAFVAFTGLDHRADDSGQHRGRRRISKRGPSELRRLLYLAVMTAKKTETWKPLFENYRAKGISGTESVVILARHIARTAWSIYTYKTEFDPLRLTKCLI